MKFKRSLIGVMVLGLLTSSSVVFATDLDAPVSVDIKPISDVMPITELLPIEYNVYYESVRGTVIEIKDTEFGKVLYLGEGEDIHTHLGVPNNAYIVGEEVKVGDVVTGYFEGGMMYPMIYPGRRTAEVLVVESKENSAYVGVLNNELLTDDGTMYVQIGEETKVVTKDGNSYDGDLAYKKVIVLYNLVRESFPAQTTADKIIVLGEQDKIKPEEKAFYESVTGKIEEIRDSEDKSYISIVDTNGSPANIVITRSTLIIENIKLTVGSTITAYFEAGLPMIMIYPPQYTAEVLVVENADKTVHVGIFNKEFLSDDGTLILKNIESAEIVTRNGKEYKDSIVGKKVAVLYSISTKSLPAQTTPIKIIVLDKTIEEMDFRVMGNIIKAPKAYEKNGVIMVPLRAIAESVGLQIEWVNDLRMVHVGKVVSLTIGQDAYNFAKMVPIKLGTAPEIKDNITYVPLNFFIEVIKENKAEIINNEIVIE